MEKIDVIYKLAVVSLLGVIAYQQHTTKNLLDSIDTSAGRISMNSGASGVTDVRVVNNEKNAVPVAIVSPTTPVFKYGMKSEAVSVSGNQ